MRRIVLASALLVAGCTSAPGTSPAGTPRTGGADASSASLGSTSAPGSLSIPTPQPSATVIATIPLCRAGDLAARVTSWDSGAGHRTAQVELTNAGPAPCRMRPLDRPQMVDGHGSVLIDGLSPATSVEMTVAAGGVLKTMVDASNYCGPSPVAPVTVAFVFPSGSGRFVATPLSPTDLGGVPPCLGSAGSAGSISMTGWAP